MDDIWEEAPSNPGENVVDDPGVSNYASVNNPGGGDCMFCALSHSLNDAPKEYREWFGKEWGPKTGRVDWWPWDAKKVRAFLGTPGVIPLAAYQTYLASVWADAYLEFQDQNPFPQLWENRVKLLSRTTPELEREAIVHSIMTDLVEIMKKPSFSDRTAQFAWLLYDVGKSLSYGSAEATEDQLRNFQRLLSRPGWEIVGDESQIIQFVNPAFHLTTLVVSVEKHQVRFECQSYNKFTSDWYVLLEHQPGHWVSGGIRDDSGKTRFFLTSQFIEHTNIPKVFSLDCLKNVLTGLNIPPEK